MIIKSDAFLMESRRQYASRRTTRQSIHEGLIGQSDLSEGTQEASENKEAGEEPCELSQQNRPFSGMGSFIATLAYTKEGLLADNTAGMSDIPAVKQGRLSSLQRLGALPESMGNIEDASLQLKFSALNYLFRAMFGKSSFGSLTDSFWGTATSGGYQTIQFSEVYEETEMTSFETTGKVMTEDGREMEFNLNIGMSRSFYQETNIQTIREKPILMDPLIVHMDENAQAISDQTFFFDLDADGEEDEIPSLNAGHGFLALDKNGDGMINDGSELFGATSGDGFAELAAYDLDGNGWIDEADPIFDRLKVWSMDENGQPQLFTLEKSDIGAICLASVPTRFSVNDEQNSTRAMVRQSGFFLHESTGKAGAVQQIDLAMMD